MYRLIVAAVATAVCFRLAAQEVRTGAQIATFHSAIDDSSQPYALYVPESFDPGKKYPLVISLHEEETNHRINLRRVLGIANPLGVRDTEDMRYFPPVHGVEFIVASPLARGTMGYRGIAEQDVYDALADIERRFPIDRDRVYLTGIGMGGAGALRFALTRPDIWAAVAPLCPGPLPDVEPLAGNALHLPIRIFQGEQDPIVPPASARTWQRRLVDAGDPAGYIEYPAIRHNVWDEAYREGATFRWFGGLRREASPARVRFATSSYRYDSAYWVRIDGLTPGTQAAIDASWVAENALKVETRNLDGFTVTTDRKPGTLLAVTIDGVGLRVKAAPSLSFSKASSRWAVGRITPAGKRPGAEGPIGEAVASRHIYVYGTGGANAAELEARRKVAETAAAWSTPRSPLLLRLPVKADTEVTDADIDSANLILFGTAESNRLVARFAPRLPLTLSPAAADYGLLFITPVGTHYVVVNSGLPWWTGAEEAHRGGDRLEPWQMRLLSTFGDYILFKGSLSNVVVEGRFDRNWKLAPDAAAKMRATGTVAISQP